MGEFKEAPRHWEWIKDIDRKLAIELMHQRIIMDRIEAEELDNRRVKQLRELQEKLKNQKK